MRNDYIGSGSEDIGGNVLRLSARERESRRLEDAHRAAEEKARDWRLKQQRLIQAALDRLLGDSTRSIEDIVLYANSDYTGGTAPKIANVSELFALDAEIRNSLSPVVTGRKV